MEPDGKSSLMWGKDLEVEIKVDLDVLIASVRFPRKPSASEGLVRLTTRACGTNGTAAKNS
jgi:hypothetical protein